MDQDPRPETLDPGPETQDSGIGPKDLESRIKEPVSKTQTQGLTSVTKAYVLYCGHFLNG